MRYTTLSRQATLIKTRLTSLDTRITVFLTRQPLTDYQLAKVKTIDETIVKKHSEFETIVNNLYNTDPLPEDIDEKEVIALQESISDL